MSKEYIAPDVAEPLTFDAKTERAYIKDVTAGWETLRALFQKGITNREEAQMFCFHSGFVIDLNVLRRPKDVSGTANVVVVDDDNLTTHKKIADNASSAASYVIGRLTAEYKRK